MFVVWAAALKDYKTFTIPHLYPLVILMLWPLGLVAALTDFFQPIDVLYSFLTAAIVFICGLLFFALKMMGGGDVKLLTALALWINLKNLHIFLFLIVMAGLVYTIWYAGWQYYKAQQKTESETSSKALKSVRKMKVPYGPAIALGLTAYLGLIWA